VGLLENRLDQIEEDTEEGPATRPDQP